MQCGGRIPPPYHPLPPHCPPLVSSGHSHDSIHIAWAATTIGSTEDVARTILGLARCLSDPDSGVDLGIDSGVDSGVDSGNRMHATFGHHIVGVVASFVRGRGPEMTKITRYQVPRWIRLMGRNGGILNQTFPSFLPPRPRTELRPPIRKYVVQTRATAASAASTANHRAQ